MNDKEILEVLKEMLADYEAALISIADILEFEDFLKQKNIDYGFCSWLCKDYRTPVISMPQIMDDLKLDFQGKSRDDGFLYATSWDFNGTDRIKKYALLPRAKNIKRTIERIEKRILENINVIMPQQI